MPPGQYATAADLVAETGDTGLREALLRFWKDLNEHKIVGAGAVGPFNLGMSQRRDAVAEAFGIPYDPPNSRPQLETCANIGNALRNWRMLSLSGDARLCLPRIPSAQGFRWREASSRGKGLGGSQRDSDLVSGAVDRLIMSNLAATGLKSGAETWLSPRGSKTGAGDSGRVPLVTVSHHVLAAAGLANLDAEFEQFALDARRAPQWVISAHLVDQFAGFFRNRWPSGLRAPDLPSQKIRKPLRCQAMTVSGFTMTSADHQSNQVRHSQTRRRRSETVSLGRFGAAHFKTPSWWRSARFSN